MITVNLSLKRASDLQRDFSHDLFENTSTFSFRNNIMWCKNCIICTSHQLWCMYYPANHGLPKLDEIAPVLSLNGYDKDISWLWNRMKCYLSNRSKISDIWWNFGTTQTFRIIVCTFVSTLQANRCRVQIISHEDYHIVLPSLHPRQS